MIERQSGGGAIRQLGIGAHVIASVDRVRLGERGAVYLSVKPSVAKMGPAVLYAGDIAFGLRF